MKIFVSAGETSGDAILGAVLQRLRARHQEMELCGLGGPMAQACGLLPLFPLEKTAVNGGWDVLRHALFLLRMYRHSVAALIGFHPDLVILVDYPGLNLRLAQKARALGIPIYFLAPPQTWVYRKAKHRKARVARALAGCSVHVLFPFEAETFAKTARRVTVGHFMITNQVVRQQTTVSRPILCLCPGSRMPVLVRNLPVWLDHLNGLGIFGVEENSMEPKVQILVPEHLGTQVTFWLDEFRQGRYAHLVPIRTDKDSALAQADRVIAFPGTITLELARLRVPTLVLAILDPFTLVVGKRILKSPRLALPNLLLGEGVFPEWAGTATNLTVTRFRGLLENLLTWNPSWELFANRLETVVGLGSGAEIVAEECLELLGLN